jgi:hypothetical protein
VPYFDCCATAASRLSPGAVEYLNGENVARTPDFGANCHLDFIDDLGRFMGKFAP